MHKADSYPDETNDQLQLHRRLPVWRDNERVIREVLRPVSTLRANAMCLEISGDAELLSPQRESLAGQWAVLNLPPSLIGQEHNQQIVGDARRLPYMDRSFDFIAAHSILPHRDNTDFFLEIHRVLDRDGIAVIAEEVLGDYEGEAGEWYRQVQANGNVLGNAIVTREILSASLKTAGFEITSVVEFRGVRTESLPNLLSRPELASDRSRRAVAKLFTTPPKELTEVGLEVSGDRIRIPYSMAVISSRPVIRHPQPGLVATLIPVRMTKDGLMVYVQERRAPILEEPEFVGQYEFPQGHVEPGETIDEAASRELMEEAGLRVLRVLHADNFAKMILRTNTLTVEEATPERVIVARGRLNFVSLVYLVETNEDQQDQIGAIDNRGQWVNETRFRQLVDEQGIYPLNIPTFSWVRDNWQRIRNVFPRVLDPPRHRGVEYKPTSEGRAIT